MRPEFTDLKLFTEFTEFTDLKLFTEFTDLKLFTEQAPYPILGGYIWQCALAEWPSGLPKASFPKALYIQATSGSNPNF